MSPTVFRQGSYRFFFFSREESRRHVHVVGPDGEAKFWIEPEIELATSKGLSAATTSRLKDVVSEHIEEIHNAWNDHFSR